MMMAAHKIQTAALRQRIQVSVARALCKERVTKQQMQPKATETRADGKSTPDCNERSGETESEKLWPDAEHLYRQ